MYTYLFSLTFLSLFCYCLLIQLSAAGWAPTESKVEAIVEWPAPETVKQLRSFLGMAIFLRTFLPLYSETSAPLADLLKNTKHGQHRLNWTLECELAFAKIKEDLDFCASFASL